MKNLCLILVAITATSLALHAQSAASDAEAKAAADATVRSFVDSWNRADGAAPPPSCPKSAALHGDSESKDGTEKEREDADANKDCDGKTTGDDHVADGHGDHCDGTADDLQESADKKSAVIESNCISTDADGKTEPAKSMISFVNNGPLGPTTFMASWVTASGKVYGAQGIMLNGITSIQ